ncbi:MAG: hypothetical protein JWP97_3371 [Labilithrix sp.]|nr:hypothetical protein [Labilithrix sp.]
MKHRVLVSLSSFALLAVVAPLAILPVAACHPQQPKQASGGDDGIVDDSASSGGSSSGGGSSSSGASRNDNLASPPSGPMGKAAKGEPTPVSSLNGLGMMEGLRWGMSHAEVTKAFTENGGILSKDYDAKLAKARVGPEMTAIEAEREGARAAFARSYLEFKDTPTGFDATGLRGEYTYKNRESLLSATRDGKPKRYFFFINDRLWKIYDEVPLAENGPLGKSYIDAVNKMNEKLGAQGRIQGADAEKGINTTTVDWKDGSNHLRVIDRSSDHVAGVALEDNGTVSQLASLRPNKMEDPTAIDPTIAAVTKGGLSDPNAAKAAPSASAPAGKKGAPPKKK